MLMVDAPDVGLRIQATFTTHQGEVQHTGLVSPPAAPKHLTLKLENGYNVSFPVDSLVAYTILEAVLPNETTPLKATELNDALPRVRLIHTGGTIASKVDYTTGAVEAKFEPQELLDAIPEIASIANLDSVKIGNMFSDDIRPQHWNLMAQACATAFDEGCRGVVISHGTDTLHISSAALSFAFAGEGTRPAGPIVMVGSQRSSDRGSTDATENLLAAIHWAAYGPLPKGSCGDSVVVVMHDTSSDGVMAVHSGVAVRKMHSSRRDAFQAVNAQPIAKLNMVSKRFEIQTLEWYQEELNNGILRNITLKPTMYNAAQRIAQFIAGPWLFAEHIDAVANTGIQGIVIHGTGLGHLPIEDAQQNAPENQQLWRILTRCVNRELPVVIVNQCIHGPVDMNVYSKGRKQQGMGLLGHGLNSTPDTTVVKLHWLLSQNKSVAQLLTDNLCGEHREILME